MLATREAMRHIYAFAKLCVEIDGIVFLNFSMFLYFEFPLLMEKGMICYDSDLSRCWNAVYLKEG